VPDVDEAIPVISPFSNHEIVELVKRSPVFASKIYPEIRMLDGDFCKAGLDFCQYQHAGRYCSFQAVSVSLQKIVVNLKK